MAVDLAAPTAVGTAEVDSHGRNNAEDADGETTASEAAAAGFTLEFDAARKIAQGLGARLGIASSIVQVKADKARLSRSPSEPNTCSADLIRPRQLRRVQQEGGRQPALFEELEQVAEQQGWGEVGTPRAGSTTLDRVHQAMILFGAGRGEALRRFLVEEGVGRATQFWKLAQALSALYPAGTDEKRWIDGVLARKKGLRILTSCGRDSRPEIE